MGRHNKILLFMVLIILSSGLALAMDVQLSANPTQSTAGDSVEITALVLDNSTPMNNTLVSFTTSLGILDSLSAYTNESGIAVVSLNSETSGTATVNVSVGGASNTTNVDFTVGSPASIEANVTQSPLVVGDITQLNLTLYDQYHNINSTADLPLNISISDVSGQTIHQFNITRTPYTLTEITIDQDTVTLNNSTTSYPSILLDINSTLAGDIDITADADISYNFIYAFRGAGFNDFWRHDISANTWTSMQNAPNNVKEGGALTYDGNNYIYAFRGEGFKNFWRHDISANTWTSMQDTPNNVKEGGALTYDGNNYIYAFRGEGFKNFWRYGISANTWTSMKNAPNYVKEGGALTYDGNNYIYAFRGAGFNDFWRYDISANKWTSMQDTPNYVKEGGALAYDGNNYIYAFRGAGFNDFWRYDISANTWTSMQNAPNYVKEGGALAYDGNNYIYAFRGEVNDFWRYDISADSWTNLANTPQTVSWGGALAFIESVTNTINVDYLADSPASIEIDTNPTSLEVAEISQINLTAYDQYDNINSTAELELTINVSDANGAVIHQFNITKAPYTLTEILINSSSVTLTSSTSSNPHVLLNINSTMVGNVNIAASTGITANTTDVEFFPAGPRTLQASYDSQHLVNTTSTITVDVLDKFGNPVSNATVIFSATPPADTEYNSPVEYNSLSITPGSYTTGPDGKATATFRTDKRSGDNIIDITVQDTSVNESITIKGLEDYAVELLLSYEEGGVYANNLDVHKLSAKPVDQFLNPIIPRSVPIKEQIHFKSKAENTLLSLNSKGIASTFVGPTPYIENVTVTATYKNSTGFTDINNTATLMFVGAGPSKLIPAANPDTLLTHNDTSTVVFTAVDPWGHTLADQDIILNNTNTTLGDLTVEGVNATNLIHTTTNSRGKVVATFTSKEYIGNATITAECGLVYSSTTIKVKSEPFLNVEVSSEPENIDSGDTINITTIVSVEGELTSVTRPAASSMLVLDCSGSMDPDYYAGTPLDVVLVMDRSGSMSDSNKIVDAKMAAKEFVDQIVSNSRVGLVSFSTTSTVDQDLTQMNSMDNKSLIKNDIDAMVADGWTAMGDGMADANNMLLDARDDAKKIMVVLTDGKSNKGSDQDGTNAIANANANGTTIYTIGLGNGTEIDEPVLENIASATGGKYYHAPTSSQLREIYHSIAMEISDFDINEVEYGVDGFTPYSYQSQDTVGPSESFVDTFLINRTIDDLKVQLNWENSSINLNLELVSPNGTVYGAGNNTVGYYFNDSTPRETMEYIWVSPLSHTYPDTDSAVEKGNWTVRVKGATANESFSITTYIDKKSATKIASHAFLSSFNESRGDKAGLVTYSDDTIVNANNLTSFLHNSSTWVGYFMVDMDGVYNFNLSWDDTSDLNISLFDGITVLDSSTSGPSPKKITSSLLSGKKYHLVVSKDSSSVNDTCFTINTSRSFLDDAIAAYYDGGSGSTPKYRQWDSTQWSNELSANSVGSTVEQILMRPSPVKKEIIMGTIDDSNDLNLQIWDGAGWETPQEISSSLYSYNVRRFDIAYEQISGDALVAYMDTSIASKVPQYRIWNGSSLTDVTAVNGIYPGSGYIRWIRLAADPKSDEIILATIDTTNDIRAHVWNGSDWSNPIIITIDTTDPIYQCFDVAYEQTSGNAMLVWAENNNSIRYLAWDGTSWSAANTIYTDSYPGCWVKLASDPNSDNILMGVLNDGREVHTSVWDGATWSSPLMVEEYANKYAKRTMDVAFEQSSGRGMVVWSNNTKTAPQYRIWNGSWSTEDSAADIATWTEWVQLTPNPYSNEIFLQTSDEDSDINIQKWNGTGWEDHSEVESTSSPDYECFALAYPWKNTSVTQNPILSWTQWEATVASSFNNDSLIHLTNAIDTIPSDGLTAIDEGMYEANNELAGVGGEPVIVLMTDGLDNVGHHSMILETYRAKANNTIIHTVGFGNTESEVDPVLAEIAQITGGEYYYAPNSTALEDIFRGIAEEVVKFEAQGPILNIDLPRDYDTGIMPVTATYVANSSNSTSGNGVDFTTPIHPSRGNAEPNITIVNDKTLLSWALPASMGSGDKWGIWYQLRVEGAGYTPIIMNTSNLTYYDATGDKLGNVTQIDLSVKSLNEISVSIGGGMAEVSYPLLKTLQVDTEPVIVIGDISEVTITVTDAADNPANVFAKVYTNMGNFINSTGNLRTSLDLNISGSDTLDFTSDTAGQVYITVVATNANNASDTLTGEGAIVVRPKGKIIVS